MPSSQAVEIVLRSIPGYAEPFAAAFPGEESPITFDNMALAIASFERLLLTPSRVDAFMDGDLAALTAQEQAGLGTFMGAGCVTCHNGPGIGGGGYQKIGLVNPYDGPDPGRMAITGNKNDFQVFKVPSLRNVAKTAPYFHDASIATVDEAVRKMAHLQLGRELTEEAVGDIVAFLAALTGEVDAELVAMPTLPESGPNTPAPDPH
jgi:cytochrome c peroxidase